jgi:hypothetical protein
MSHAHARQMPRQPHVGDVVSFPFGTYTARGVVLEDRGRLGRGGERVIRVRVDYGNDLEPLVTEIPARVATVVVRTG